LKNDNKKKPSSQEAKKNSKEKAGKCVVEYLDTNVLPSAINLHYHSQMGLV